MKRTLLFILIVVLSVTACTGFKDDGILTKLEKNYGKYKGYKSRTRVKVYQEDDHSIYIIDETYNNLNSYKLEILEPPESQGMTIERFEETIVIDHKAINQSITMDSNNSLENQPYFGEFFTNASKSNFSQREKIEGEKYLIFDYELKIKNKYFNSAKIWINEKTFFPYKLNIYDDNDKIVVEILYEDFIYLN